MAKLFYLDGIFNNEVGQPSSSTRFYEASVTSLERELDIYSEFLMACNKRVQLMHAIAFNNNQCQYLIDKLKEVIESARVFLKTSCGALEGSYAPTKLENHLLSFKLLLMLATEIEGFIEGCSKDAWVPIAMTLTHMPEFVSYIGFHLELCQIALSKKCGAPGGLNLDQVVDINKDVNEIVKIKASKDKEDLLKKLSLALPSLHGDEKDLASYLLQRLLRVAPILSKPSLESKWGLFRSISKERKEKMCIGKGSATIVFKAMWLGIEVAEKVYYGDYNIDFIREVDILAKLCHFNITSMFCCTQERRTCSIFMELMDGDLFSLMQQRLEKNQDSPPFNIWEAIDIMHQIAEGGRYLHEEGIVHRDLKSMNILVKSVKTPGLDLEYLQVKVADFNISKITKSTTNTEQTMNVGTQRWMAPELIRLQSIGDQMDVGTSNQSIPKYPHKCDIYSFAIVCYEILTGELPYGDVGNPKMMKTMVLEGNRPKLPVQCPFQLKALIEKCWNPNPKSRPTFDDICQELKYMKYELMTDMSFTSKTRGLEGKRMIGQYQDALEDINKVHELEPNDPFTLETHGEVKQLMDKYTNALEDLNEADELNPNGAFTLVSRGDVKRSMGKYANALEDFNKADKLEPNNALTLGSRGEVKLLMVKFSEGLVDFNKADELDPNDAWILRNRGEVKRMMEKYVDALKDLNKANELEPNDILTLKSRGEVKKMMGKYADALEDLNKANELEPHDPFTLGTHGEVKRLMGNYANALEDLNKAYELNPNDAFILATRGEVKRLMGNYADALEDFNKANNVEPNNALTLGSCGDVKRLMGKYAEALEDFNKVDELEPNDAWTLRNRGEVEKMMEKYVDALKDLNKADKLEPNDALTLGSRGEVKRLMGKYTDALKDFNKADELQPNDAWILRNRGEVKRMMDKYVNALEDFNKANELEPNDALTLKRRGDVHQMMGKYENALEDFNKANELQSNDVFTLQSRGEVKRLMGKYADALEDFNKAIEFEPNNALILKRRGDVNRMMGKYTNALEDFNKANKHEPNNSLTLKRRGDVNRMMGKYTNALEDLNKVDELEPNNAFTLGSRGEVKRLMGKYTDALEDFNKANELEPNDAWTLRNRGEVKRMMDNYANALEDLNKANELEPNDALTLKRRGDVHRMMGKYKNALEDFNKADKYEPNNAFTLRSRGEVKQLMGKYANALEDFNKVDELHPNDAWIKEVGNLSSLITLNLSGCSYLATLPKEVGNLSSLATLDLSGCSSLTTLPKEVGNLSYLTTLNLRQCSNLATLPKEVGNLSYLTTLNLRQCSNLVTLPKEVGNLFSLITLNLEDCSILVALPKEVGNLSSLTTLNLWRCSSLVTLPKEVGNLSFLTTLNLRQCSSLAALPKEVRSLSSLTTLNLEDCSSLVAWPKEVEITSSLTTSNLEEYLNKAQVQTTEDDEHVLKKQRQEVVLTQFKAKYNSSKNFNDTIQEPLVKISSFLTVKGLHVLGSLLLWIPFHISMFRQQVLFWNKGKVESKDLITGHFLGQGCSGIFYETTWLGNHKVKFARKDFPEVMSDTFKMEAIRLFELQDHPNIVKTFCWTVDNRSCSLVMEYMKDDLSSFMQKRKEALRKKGDQEVIGVNPSPFQLLEVLDILLQIAIGVEYIHDKGIYHGDLKPNNVFLDWKEGRMLVKVADFGLLKTKRNTTLLSQQALCFRMIEWSAPELFEDFFSSMSEDLDFLRTTTLIELDPNTSSASCFENDLKDKMEKADSYSFGLTSAYVLGVEQMWPTKWNRKELRKQISGEVFRPKLPSICPEALASLIFACWDNNPTCRPTFSIIRNKMQEIIKEQL